MANCTRLSNLDLANTTHRKRHELPCTTLFLSSRWHAYGSQQSGNSTIHSGHWLINYALRWESRFISTAKTRTGISNFGLCFSSVTVRKLRNSSQAYSLRSSSGGPAFVNCLHDFLRPPHGVHDRADSRRNSLSAVKLRQLAGGKNARRDQQHALAALVHIEQSITITFAFCSL